MDIDLLSKMLKELIPDHDRICLPGLGCFVAEVVPSAFSDRGYTINPPYRRLSFRTGNLSEDNLLAELYASSNGVDAKVAEKIISDFTSEMRKILVVKKTVVFPGLGRLRATRENNFFFVADEDLDIYPEGFGLEPVSLKSHQETSEEVSAVISGLQSMIGADGQAEGVPLGPDAADTAGPSGMEEPEVIPEPETSGTEIPEQEVSEPEESEREIPEPEVSVSSEPEASEPEASEPEVAEPEESESEEPVSEMTEPEQAGPETPEQEAPEEKKPDETDVQRMKGSGPWKTVLIVVASIVGLAVLLLAAYLLMAHFCPDFIDSLLYDSEQLDVLRYGRR